MKQFSFLFAIVFLCLTGTKVTAQIVNFDNLNLNCSATVVLYAVNNGTAMTTNPITCGPNTHHAFPSLAAVNDAGCSGSGIGWSGGACATPGPSARTAIDVDYGSGVIHCDVSTSPATGGGCKGGPGATVWYSVFMGTTYITFHRKTSRVSNNGADVFLHHYYLQNSKRFPRESDPYPTQSIYGFGNCTSTL
jgi:hypothetical protein